MCLRQNILCNGSMTDSEAMSMKLIFPTESFLILQFIFSAIVDSFSCTNVNLLNQSQSRSSTNSFKNSFRFWPLTTLHINWWRVWGKRIAQSIVNSNLQGHKELHPSAMCHYGFLRVRAYMIQPHVKFNLNFIQHFLHTITKIALRLPNMSQLSDGWSSPVPRLNKFMCRCQCLSIARWSVFVVQIPFSTLS